MTAETVSPGQIEMTRKSASKTQAVVLQRLEKVSQTVAAKKIDKSDAWVSRAKDSLDDACLLIAAVGMKLVPADAVVMTQEEMRVLKRWGIEYLEADLAQDRVPE